MMFLLTNNYTESFGVRMKNMGILTVLINLGEERWCFMKNSTLALNETMQIHELLNLKTVSMTTSKLMEGVVFDQDLKKLLEKCVESSITDINELQQLIKMAPEIE